MKLSSLFSAVMSLALVGTAVVGVSTNAFAQGRQKPGAMNARRETPLMAGLKAITLTDAQKDSVKTIADKYKQERKTLVQAGRPDTTATPGDRQKPSAETLTKIADIEAKELAEVKAVLTPEQLPVFQAAYDAAKAERGNAGGGVAAQAIEKLALTDEQKTKIAPILTDMGEAMMKLRNDQSMERKEKAAKMLEIWNDAKAKIRPLLTETQQKTLDEMKGLRGGGKRGGIRPGGVQ